MMALPGVGAKCYCIICKWCKRYANCYSVYLPSAADVDSIHGIGAW